MTLFSGTPRDASVPAMRPVLLALPVLAAGCDPVIDVFGSFFPAWVVCMTVGIVLAAMTLRDAFDTVVVPGGSRASLRVAARFGALLLPVW